MEICHRKGAKTQRITLRCVEILHMAFSTATQGKISIGGEYLSLPFHIMSIGSTYMEILHRQPKFPDAFATVYEYAVRICVYSE
jgi:hypothetical protein